MRRNHPADREDSRNSWSTQGLLYLIMDAQLNIQNGAFTSAMHQENVTHDGTPYGAVRGSNWGQKPWTCLEESTSVMSTLLSSSATL